MREIKFRGLRADDVWEYGDFYTVQEKDWAVIREPKTNERFYVYPDTVGQFTGLKDCKGQEIFEGDILRYLLPWRWVDTKRIGVVVFENYSFYVKNEYTTDLLFNIAVNSDGAPFEVIGNIHDNPELLEVEV